MQRMNHFCRLCFDRYLPHEPMDPAMALGPRARAVLFFRKLWVNGSTLRVRFLGGTEAQQRLALEQGRWWSEPANLRFVPSDATDAEIRVSFDPSDGAWSYIGTDCRSIPTDQPTMNLGFQDGGTSAHEFGHAIGLGHEHQNPQGGMQWNEPEVIRDLSGPPNSWTVAQIRNNVLTNIRRTKCAAPCSARTRSCSTRFPRAGPRTASVPILMRCCRRKTGPLSPPPIRSPTCRQQDRRN